MLYRTPRFTIIPAIVVASLLAVGCSAANPNVVSQTSALQPAATSTPAPAVALQATSVPTVTQPPPLPPFTPTPGAGADRITSDIGAVGTGRVFAAPDTAIASLGVELTSPTLAQATSDASTRMTAVLAKLKELGIDAKDITTVNYNVSPQTTGPEGTQIPRIIGYRVSNVVNVKIRKIDDVGKVLDAAITAGANTLYNVVFTIDDPSKFQQDARAKAVTDARAKAQTLADAAGVKLGRVISITENTTVRPLFERSALGLGAAAGGGGPGPVETGQSEITVNVEVHYQIAP